MDVLRPQCIFLAGSILKLLGMLSCCPCGLHNLSVMSSFLLLNSAFSPGFLEIQAKTSFATTSVISLHGFMAHNPVCMLQALSLIPWFLPYSMLSSNYPVSFHSTSIE